MKYENLVAIRLDRTRRWVTSASLLPRSLTIILPPRRLRRPLASPGFYLWVILDPVGEHLMVLCKTKTRISWTNQWLLLVVASIIPPGFILRHTRFSLLGTRVNQAVCIVLSPQFSPTILFPLRFNFHIYRRFTHSLPSPLT